MGNIKDGTNKKVIAGRISEIRAEFSADFSKILYVKICVIVNRTEKFFFTADENLIFNICREKLSINDYVDIEYITDIFSNTIKFIKKY